MKKVLIIGLICIGLLTALFINDYIIFFDSRLHIVFCDVGQGDAIFVRTPSGKNLLFDAGPDASVMECLSRHMPFWERRIDMILVSHPHNDHYAGVLDVIERYTVLYFVTERLSNSTVGYSTLIKALNAHKIPQMDLYAGDTFRLSDNVSAKILGPSKEYLALTNPSGDIKESVEFASIITEVTYNEFSVLLTGDSQVNGIKNAIKLLKKTPEILQVPHHGSKTGLDKNTIQLLKPKAGIISVGKNSYGHPHREVLTIFSQADIPLFTTDQHGDIEIISDGKDWFLR